MTWGSDKVSGYAGTLEYQNYWRAYCYSYDNRSPITFNGTFWECKEGVSYPYCIMDDYGVLVPVVPQ